MALTCYPYLMEMSYTPQLDKLASCLSFLTRNGMPVVIVHGINPVLPSQTDFQHQVLADSIKLVSLLEQHGTKARPVSCSSDVFHAASTSLDSKVGCINRVDIEPLKSFIGSGQIPILTAVGKSPSGQTLYIDPTSAAVELAAILQPTKVVFLNTEGGLRDSSGQVVDSVSVPDELGSLLRDSSLHCSSHNLVKSIRDLLLCLPSETSAVITSANSLITELFTHNGSGTLFQVSEQINAYHSLENVDVERLRSLIIRSFDQDLSLDYFSKIERQLHTIYISESYSAAAIITVPKDTGGVPYLDKFTVSKESQGKGTSEKLWKKITKDFEKLFWRSRGTNRINPWYFMRSNGSWTNGLWTVFWYGITEQHHTLKLVMYANSLPSSFDPIAPHDGPEGRKQLSTNAYHKYL
ncbi:N-acetylglutamate synthase, mitochondrial isoform X2 [Nematostella vectensis]|uniref:N-acetylglutamate synthase, mitochondrial isoform X2 n=1 Tax=Nematostella vectensis TaxID=45351 RepID=UPI0020773BF1|nr:N-acetylglutamate synthase, mitochondrial isoform X2 [Nematostella vectensis]